MSEADSCVRFRVSGRVQGVFFRASAAEEARRLGLRGRAVNLADGRVEVLAIGPSAAVAELASWLERGPRMATVTDVEAMPVDADSVVAPAGFVTG